MLVTGSQALIDWGVRLGRKPSDIDVIATPSEYESVLRSHGQIEVLLMRPNKRAHRFRNGKIIEFEIADENNSTGVWLLDNYSGLGYPESKERIGLGRSVHPDVCLTLKLSHRYLKNSPHFRKTMDDILALRGLKYRVPPQLQEWLKDREKETYSYGHPSLKRDKAKFFSGDGVDYKYEHDDIHEALATIVPEWRGKPRPAYVQFQKDSGIDVSVSKWKWDNFCDEDTKLHSVLEESYVLALERSQIPNDFAIAPRTSFLIALEKVCTSITSGWWREYAWENYYRVLAMYSDDYVDRFQRALLDGKIRPYQGVAA